MHREFLAHLPLFEFVSKKRVPMLKLTITIMLAMFATCCYSQDAIVKSDRLSADEIAATKIIETDLHALRDNLLTQSDDMGSIAKSLNGFDFNNAMTISDHAQRGAIYLDAAYWFVGLYSVMQCDKDKNLTKAVLQDRLRLYSHMLDLAVDSTNGNLGLTRVPAVAQQGQRIRDELRSAKIKLDEIVSTLK